MICSTAGTYKQTIENKKLMHISVLSPRMRGEGTTPGKLTYKTVLWVGILSIHGAPII